MGIDPTPSEDAGLVLNAAVPSLDASIDAKIADADEVTDAGSSRPSGNDGTQGSPSADARGIPETNA